MEMSNLKINRLKFIPIKLRLHIKFINYKLKTINFLFIRNYQMHSKKQTRNKLNNLNNII
jgi:hypothetical protein